MQESGGNSFAIIIKVSILRDCSLQHTNFLVLSDKYLVIESAGNTASLNLCELLWISFAYLALDAALIDWMAEVVGINGENGSVGCVKK